MNRIILADDQPIFRAGAARVLALEDDMRIVAQCDDLHRLMNAVENFRVSVLIFSSGLKAPQDQVLKKLKDSGSLAILITEKNEPVSRDLSVELGGVIGRSTTGPELIDTVRRVARGQRGIQLAPANTAQLHDAVGARVRDRLTPKEMQIVSLIVQGSKNKDIAARLGTKEQVIKNYLRSIYDKTGVSDRLELALFTLHHRILAEAAAKAGSLLQKRSA